MKNIYRLIGLLIGMLCQETLLAQDGVSIGSTNPPPASALLELKSDSKGFLPPRMSTAQRKAIASPASGLIVFDIDQAQLYLFDGTQWQALTGGASGNNSIIPPQIFPPTGEIQGNGYFGVDVDINGSYAVVGCPGSYSGATRSGAAFVYKKNPDGSWEKTAKLLASDPQTNANFGATVAVHGNYIVVGSPLFDVGAITDGGKVYIFVKGVDENWTQQAAFTKDGGPVVYDYFGINVDISSTATSGPVMIAGAPSADLSGNNRGIACTYRFNGTSWVFIQTLAPADRADNDNFGYELTIDGDYCAISAPYQKNIPYNTLNAGAVYIYVLGGGVWTLQQKLSGFTAESQFGYSLSISGDKIAIGAPMASPYSNTTAQVSIYSRSAATWSNSSNIYIVSSSGFDVTNRLGIALCLDGNNLLISMPAAYQNHIGGTSTYVKLSYCLLYKSFSGNFVFQKMINDNDPFPPNFGNNIFGNSVSLTNGNYIIGVPNKTVNGVGGAGTVAFGYIE